MKYLFSEFIQTVMRSSSHHYLLLDFHAKTRTRFSLRDKRLFEINEVEKRESTAVFFFLYAPNFEEVRGAYCFWGVRPSVRHAF